MATVICRNPNDAFPLTMKMLKTDGVEVSSRAGDGKSSTTVEFPEAVQVIFTHPCERVLFHSKRQINPFLHFFEPLWIIAGRDDVGFLAGIVKRMASFSDDGEHFYGAYGHRLRYPIDQISEAITRLRKNPHDRQCVLQIRSQLDMRYAGRDMPCNTSAALKIRDGALNMHVFNRSNDAIWGGPAGGTNHPQFTTLQEYLARKIGVDVGRYTITTDSMHAYTNEQWSLLKDASVETDYYLPIGGVRPYPLMERGEEIDFEHDIIHFFNRYDSGKNQEVHFRTRYFNDVVTPMYQCLGYYKRNALDAAMAMSESIQAMDWRLITEQFIHSKIDRVPT